MFDYDCIVVGCGPAGLMAVAELQKKGITVLGVDKKPRLDQNIRSASGFFFDGQEMNGETIQLSFQNGTTKILYPRCGFSLDYPRPMEGIHHTHIISSTGTHFQGTSRTKPLYHLFDPTTWLAYSYKHAQHLQAPFLTGTLAIRAQETNGGVEVILRAQGRTFKKTCRKLVAADGLQSRITRNLGLNKHRTVFGKAVHLEHEMIDVDCPFDRGDMYIFGATYVGGPGAIIAIPSPRDKSAYRFETISGLPGKRGTGIMEFFTASSPFAPWFTNAEIVDTSYAVVELSTPITIPYYKNVLVVGDAAAYAECLYQGATMCGYMAAHAIENELKGKNGFKEYTRWWNDSFEWNSNAQRMADYVKRILFPHVFTPEELDCLFNLSQQYPAVADEMDAGVYDYTNFLMDYFSGLPGVPEDLITKMRSVKAYGMGELAAVVSKVM